MASRTLRPGANNISYTIDEIPEMPAPSDKQPERTKPTKPTYTPITLNHSPPKLLYLPLSLQSRFPEVTDFIPMKEYYPPHLAYNRLPPNIHGLKAISPLSIFSFFFSIALLKTMVTNTNAYAEATLGVSSLMGREWKAITIDELKIWIDICIYMGLFTVPSVKDDWKHNGLHPIDPITKYMGYT